MPAKYGGTSIMKRALPLSFVQTAGKGNRQQTTYGEQKNDDNHGWKDASLINGASEVPS
jgi:hypothetical protein